MTKAFFYRLGAIVLLCWITGAMASWLLLGPSDNLVGARVSRSAKLPDYRLAPEDLSTAIETLKNNPIWGLERDGKPPKTEAAKKEEEEKKKIVWHLLAAVKKTDERYILVKINNDPPSTIKEGEQLPDGSKLLEVADKILLVEDAGGEKRQIYLSF